MTKEFFLQRRGIPYSEEEENLDKVNDSQLWTVMNNPEFSLAPNSSGMKTSNSSASLESNSYACKKRKGAWEEPTIQASIELQHEDPLPLDWEQCLHLQSGRMYYLNRKTLKKSWTWPKEQQRLDLELNISTPRSSEEMSPEDPHEHQNSSSNMVAVACLRCHLFVMLCKSSPSCPNCKYVHSLMPQTQQTAPLKVETRRSLETLSLLN